MKFTVLWAPRAESALAQLWTSAPDRNAVALAADTIDNLLRDNPLSVGESRPDNRRIIFVLPLAVTYTVSELDRTVKVLKVWRPGKR